MRANYPNSAYLLFSTILLVNNKSIIFCVPTRKFLHKKHKKMFGYFIKNMYLCNSYPENNLFTLEKRLIPIEDMKRLPVRVVALFF